MREHLHTCVWDSASEREVGLTRGLCCMVALEEGIYNIWIAPAAGVWGKQDTSDSGYTGKL